MTRIVIMLGIMYQYNYLGVTEFSANIKIFPFMAIEYQKYFNPMYQIFNKKEYEIKYQLKINSFSFYKIIYMGTHI